MTWNSANNELIHVQMTINRIGHPPEPNEGILPLAQPEHASAVVHEWRQL
jgi:hypothetical protein